MTNGVTKMIDDVQGKVAKIALVSRKCRCSFVMFCFGTSHSRLA